VAGGLLAPHDPLLPDPAHALAGPGPGHWFGTDYLGRDVLSRLLAGTGRTVVAAVEAVAFGAAVGVPAGLAAQWLPRPAEWLLLRAVDAFMTLPFIVFAVAVTGVLGNGLAPAMFAIGVLYAPMFFRVTRAAAAGLVRAQYVEAAELAGAGRAWILRHHVWSKVAPTVAVTAAHATGTALLAVASLTFLGIGVQPPAPTWGGVLATELGYLAQQPWAPLIPAAFIMAAVASLNILADAIRDRRVAAPKSRRPRTATTVGAPDLAGAA
jgi:peptide/nickel transport system permease protein